MKALVSPNEKLDKGVRIVSISDAEFDVPTPLFWVDIANDATIDSHYYDMDTQAVVEFPAHSAIDPNTAIKSEILSLEKNITIRRLAEAAISAEGKAWMTDIQNQIAELRKKLV